ncbi:MAG: DUF3861 domain-containing protein [Azoarcus sp.]|jgi:hypothetical protein|nr:DUF3861 domain-containing protein [Azoarcus sp.]
MEKYRYRITLEQLDAAPAETASRTLQFGFGNHDDIFAILGRLERRGDFAVQDIPQFVVGLKLLGNILMTNKENALFASFKSHFVEFMRELKKGTPGKPGDPPK